MFSKKNILLVVSWLLLFIVCFAWIRQCTSADKNKEEEKEDKQVVNHTMVIQKIESIGRLELVKFYIKDIVEHTTELDWWPDPKVVLMVSGEAVGCVDLKGLDSTDISMSENEITVVLPHPELCYFKINHNESKVYNMEGKLMDESKLIDKAYRQAEAQIKAAALRMGILDQTKTNAQQVLKPMLENFTGKRVNIIFK